jgi:hypothetical protein
MMPGRGDFIDRLPPLIPKDSQSKSTFAYPKWDRQAAAIAALRGQNVTDHGHAAL